MKTKTFKIEYDENKTKDLTADIVETSMNYANRYVKYRVSEVLEDIIKHKSTPTYTEDDFCKCATSISDNYTGNPLIFTCSYCHKPIRPEHPALYKAIKYLMEHSKEVQEFIRRQEKELEERK